MSQLRPPPSKNPGSAPVGVYTTHLMYVHNYVY